MAKGNEVRATLRRLNPRDLGNRQHIALLMIGFDNHRQGLWRHRHLATRAGNAQGFKLVTNIHHGRLTISVNVRKYFFGHNQLLS